MTAIFPSLDEGELDYIRGLWHGYACALADAYGEVQGSLHNTGGTWKGERAALFSQWWEPASKDFEHLIDAAQRMAQAYKILADACPNINKLSAQMYSLVAENTHPGYPGTYWFHGTGAHKNDTLTVQIAGWDIEPINGLLKPEAEPKWYSELRTCLRQVYLEYNDAAHQATAAIGDAPSLLRSMAQLKEISRDSKAWNSNSPMGSLFDPTWNQLTGGGVFRPPLPPGFLGYQFSTKGMPSWYEESAIDKFGNWFTDHYGDILDVAVLIATLAGQAEVAGIISFVQNGVEVAAGVIKHDWADVVTGAIGMAIPIGDAAGGTAEEVADHLDIPKGFSRLLADAFQIEDKAMPIRIAESIADKVQDEVEEYIKKQLQGLPQHEKPPKQVLIPPAILQQCIASAAEQMGYNQATSAAAG
jgi:uncharacterized protein YukE